jgi:predicted phosphodiesterase
MPILLPALSRRGFLAAGAALGVSAALPALAADEAVPVDAARIALLSDSHIDAKEETIKNGVQMAANLKQVVADVLAARPRPVVAVVCGDLAVTKGLAGDYAMLVKLLEPLRAAGIPLALMLGNHDDRAVFWEAVPKPEGERPLGDKHVAAIETDHATLLLTDSLDKVNVTPGLLGSGQLGWLAKSLDAKADKPALVFTHHNRNLAEKGVSGITDSAEFWKAVAPRNRVKAHIFGHTHTWKLSEHDGIHEINLPPTSYAFAKEMPSGWVDLRLAAGGATVELRSVDAMHAKHGQKTTLMWRT